MAVLQDLSKLPGPRQVLLGGAVLYLCVAMLPWYRIEGRGFVIEFSGWHDLGVLVGILAIDVAAWEALRLSGYAPVEEERGDRFSALGGLVMSLSGAVFVLQRLSEGSLAYGWLLGGLIVTAMAAASVSLFVDARGPEALAAFFGRGDEEEEPPPPVAAERPRPRTPTAAARRDPGPAARAAGGGWRDSPYGRPSFAAADHAPAAGPDGRAPLADRGPDAGQAPTADRRPDAGRAPMAERRPDSGRAPLADRRPDAGRAAPAAAPWRTMTDDRPAPEPGPWRGGSSPATATGRRGEQRGRGVPPPWRGGTAERPAGGWPKTTAEKQRDAPPLWGERSARERGGGRARSPERPRED